MNIKNTCAKIQIINISLSFSPIIYTFCIFLFINNLHNMREDIYNIKVQCCHSLT